jgi:23S rRNA pseudouridine955/2504/2580 synthase
MTQNKKILAIDNNKRLDKFCLKELKHTSFAHVLKNIKLGNILVNETTKPANYKLQTNDVVTFNLNLAVKKAVVSTIVPPMKLDVVYEDKNILVINKPAGLSSHSDTNNTDSLLKQAQAYYRPQHLSIQLCNRLDKNTAGLIVLTKNDLAHTEMNKLIMQHDVKKYYLCKIYGAFIKPHQILKD